MRHLLCIGTLTRPCPSRASWTYTGIGVPRKRCWVCIRQEHNERTALDRVLRQLRSRGLVSYRVLDRAASLYEIRAVRS